MELLITVLITFLNLSWAVPSNTLNSEQAQKILEEWNKGVHKDHCDSTNEYIKALTFLRNQTDIPLTEAQARSVSQEVAKGCNGASERFAKAFLLMKKSGVALSKSIEIGVLFTKESPLTIQNFYDVFSRTYLGEFFDLDFQTSLQIALELSRDFMGNLETARQDFNNLTRFCTGNKNLALPLSLCAKMAVEFARLSQYYPRGIYEPFMELYSKLREDKRFGVSIQQALQVCSRVLKYGPKAKDNFLQAFNFSVDPRGLDSKGLDGLELGLKLAKYSSRSYPPPLYPGPQLFSSTQKDGTKRSNSNSSSNE